MGFRLPALTLNSCFRCIAGAGVSSLFLKPRVSTNVKHREKSQAFLELKLNLQAWSSQWHSKVVQCLVPSEPALAPRAV